MKGDKFQYALIGLGVIATLLFSVFFYRELFPEYKIYQEKYVELENFRSSLTKEAPPVFSYGIKQIVSEREDKGPAKVERCISCHVALKIADFSPTKLVYDQDKKPVQVANENYIWKKLDEKIDDLRKNGQTREAEKLAALKVAQVGEYIYDVTKVLRQHPLIGAETRPFENHPMDEYGCIVCHNGNGFGLVTDRAHGPVFDETYEIESTGFKPQFLEKDEKNDPEFSRIFNHKPGHRLLFQVNPLYIGSLIQAKCVNCHIPSNQPATGSNSVHFNPDLLTQNYQRGETLFIAEACYACHRISGLARGGVGPELTNEGNVYPWFVKESIVWPQADLKTSTMPNYHLDHEELEDLTTFLLAQKGERKGLSGMEYRNKIAKWEAGEKQPFEKPVAAAEILDVNYGLTVFATEGCAACHRLKGYSSDVGFAATKDPAQLLKESEWFQGLFNEQILGSELAKVIEDHGPEIDKRIVSGVRKESLLEKIESEHPGLIASFYAPFKFAGRISQDPLYQERLHKVLMMYVQEYGLGRQIGPRPNWSGVYRSDKWLLEHFKNPQALVPRSIMPAFPFDETKFYALTHMLDVVGRKNTDELRARWDLTGFRAEKAYQLLCAQCHGTYLEGNGPVAEWTYPIPKNLKNAEFLRNLTQERANYSITHGVAGTPMPPWGELGVDVSGKPKPGAPVLSAKEIEALVDWLFSSLSGGAVIKESNDVPKWRYEPEDVIKDLENEGGHLQKAAPLGLRYNGRSHFIAAAGPVQTAGAIRATDELFDKIPDPTSGPDQALYYIKKEYYTPENIEAGQDFFWENCAACHGKEADGAGLRAEAMFDAKPRMLTNLNWSDSRDDMRLLRSIKYGVPGTSMSPWGDLTNSKQRLQLVIFIRSLTASANLRLQLQNALFEAFDQTDLTLEKSRQKTSADQISATKALSEATLNSEKNPTIETLKAQLEAKQRLVQIDKQDQRYHELREALKKQKEIYQSIGQQILTQPNPEGLLSPFVKLILLNQNKINLNDQTLKWTMSHETVLEAESRSKEFILAIDGRLAGSDSAVLQKLKTHFLQGMEQSRALDEQQQKLIESMGKSE